MEEPNITVSEAQLKGRRTSLGKKSQEELINIILRKDKTERNNSAKIKLLTEANYDYLKRIDAFDKDMEGIEEKYKTDIKEVKDQFEDYTKKTDDLLATKQETIDNLNHVINTEEKVNKEMIETNNKEIAHLKSKCNLLRKTVWCLFGIVVIMIVIFIVLGF